MATPVPVDTSGARSAGVLDGRHPGAQEGHERGKVDGQRSGLQEGERAGFDRCFRELKDRNFDAGYADGYRQGDREGSLEGEERGTADGRAKGETEGREDGRRKADQDAAVAASPAGKAKGIEQANRSDATARGNADGLVAGDRQAAQRALEVDYPAGRKAYRESRYAEPVENTDEFSNLAAGANASRFSKLTQAISSARNEVSTLQETQASPDYRYYSPNPRYGTTEENTAYIQGYREGYNQGFSSEYDSSFRNAQSDALRRGQEIGCREAERRDYREFYARGVEQGRLKGHQDGYQRGYDNAHRVAYRMAFDWARDKAYGETYPVAYERHFENARAHAYAERVNELYEAAFEAARARKFAEVYPRYAEEQQARGRADEARDFAERPVRVLDAEVTETILNGVFEPGEALRVKLQLRNFAPQAVQGKDVVVKLEALNSNSAIISQSSVQLRKGLNESSVTTVSELLEFRMNESAANEARAFRLSVWHKGVLAGEQNLTVRSKFWVGTGFESVELKEGLKTEIKVRLANQGNQPTPVSKIKLLADTRELEILNPAQDTDVLNPGESRIISYTVIARTTAESVKIPLALTVTDSSGRRIGLLDEDRRAPVSNDYRIALTVATDSLRKAGVTRAYYKVRNTGSRLLYKWLQLKIRVVGTENPDNFVVIGPNPQFLKPLERGETAQFVVPVLVKEDNAGGILELEIMEDGDTAAIHQAEFTKQQLN